MSARQVPRRPIERGGISIEPPPGCEARVRSHRPDAQEAGAGVVAPDALASRLVLHVSTVPLPDLRGDFGSNVVEALTAADVFVGLVELEPDQADTAFIRREGIPRTLAATRYSPESMQRTIHGQSGTQVFFTEAGRAFCLYVVLGSHARRAELAPVVNGILAAITIAEA